MLQIALSDEEMTQIKVIDLDELYNFAYDGFFSWNHLVLVNVVWSCHNLKFKFKTVQTKSYRKMTKTKVVDLDKLYNFAVDNFPIWNHLLPEKLFEFLIFLNLNFI